MADTTEISWCDATFNPWFGCTKVGPGCDHCYAETLMATRYGKVEWGAGKPRRRTSAANWRKPVRWNAMPFYQCKCGARGSASELGIGDRGHGCGPKFTIVETRRRVFCASLADVFDNEVDPAWREQMWLLIDETPNLDWLLLTKRIGNVAKMLSEWTGVMPANVWLGATVVNQEEADRDIPKLLTTPARVRFLSIEPMLGPIDLTHIDMPGGYYEMFPLGAPEGREQPARTIDWVIAGGESGPGARPMHSEWVRSLRNQCAAAGVPFHFKQWGQWSPNVDGAGRSLWVAADGRGAIELDSEEAHRAFAGETGTTWRMVESVGKKAAGRELDGRTHDEFPQVRA